MVRKREFNLITILTTEMNKILTRIVQPSTVRIVRKRCLLIEEQMMSTVVLHSNIIFYTCYNSARDDRLYFC